MVLVILFLLWSLVGVAIMDAAIIGSGFTKKQILSNKQKKRLFNLCLMCGPICWLFILWAAVTTLAQAWVGKSK
jgi:hypothetical protein